MHGAVAPYLARLKPPRTLLRLEKQRQEAIVAVMARILRRGEPTVFAFEATCRYGMRASLCIAGWSWPIADLTAARIVSAALAQIGARRPSWLAGQPEYAQDGVIVSERTRCLNCGRRLPEGHFKFCHRRCKRAFERDLADDDERRARAARNEAYRAAFRTGAEPRECPECGTNFKPSTPKQTYCSIRCRNLANGRKSPWKTTGAAAVSGAARSFQTTRTRDRYTAPGAAVAPVTVDCALAPEPKSAQD